MGGIMKLFKKIPMRFEEKDYEIRLLYNESKITVVAFYNNHPASGYRHQLKLPKKCDIGRLLEQYPVNELIESCKNDVTEKRWEKLSKVIQENTRSHA
jgi:hypothetical protein